MSSLSAITSSASALQQSQALGTSSATPVVDEANLPAAIRNGTADQKKDYQTALSFESVLVGQMTKSMMATTGMPGMDGSASSDDSSSGGDDASQQMLKQTLPDTLASAIMNNGGLGLAQQLDSTYPTTTTSLSAGSTTGGVTAGAASGAASGDTAPAATADASSDAGQGGTAA